MEIRVDGGVAGAPTVVGMPEGTVIEVVDLFYNVPARRKFLKSDGAESSHISRMMTQLALGYPAVGFSLTSGRRQLLRCAPVTRFEDRFFQIYGERTDLVEVDKSAAGIRVRGFVAALADRAPSRGPQNIYVNGRVVKDRTITHAIHDAYSRATVKQRTPEVHLFIELPPDRVDVNVHPTKAEVRFLEQSLVHELVRRALGEALGSPSSTSLLAPLPPPGTASGPTSPALPGVVETMAAPSRWAGVTRVFARDRGPTFGSERTGTAPRRIPGLGLGAGEETWVPSPDL